MKKTFAFLLSLLVLLCGCSGASQSFSSDSFLYYYPAVDVSYEADGAFLTAPASENPEGQTLDSIIRCYLNTPVPNGAAEVLPLEWVFTSVELENATAHLEFNGLSADTLSKSLAFACLAKTILQLPDIQRLSISYPGASDPMILSSSDVLLTDTGMLPQESVVSLYFPDSNRRYLVRETVSIDASDPVSQARCVMEQLLSTKTAGQFSSCIPDGTALLDIEVENGLCTVNLSSQFVQNLEKSFAAERMAVYSIVNSLTELPEISTVDFLVAGAPIETLYLMNLSNGVTRDETILASVSDSGISDVTIYPLGAADGLLVAIPLALEVSDDLPLANTVLNALLDYEGRNGLQRCIPAGTKLLSARMENNTLVLDLTAEFLAGCTNEAEEALAVRSVVASMCALPKIQSVDIMVEGLEPAYRDNALSFVHQADQSWFTE